jgi:hypothetical protein
MNEHASDRGHGPGLAWLARRIGKRPEDLTGSPIAAASALGDGAREIASLAARLESRDPASRAAARAEADELRRQIDTAPSPGETLGKRLAQTLRDTADRLRHDGS